MPVYEYGSYQHIAMATTASVRIQLTHFANKPKAGSTYSNGNTTYFISGLKQMPKHAIL